MLWFVIKSLPEQVWLPESKDTLRRDSMRSPVQNHINQRGGTSHLEESVFILFSLDWLRQDIAKLDRNVDNLFGFYGQPLVHTTQKCSPQKTISVNTHILYRLRNILPGETWSELCTSHVPLCSMCPFHSLNHRTVELMGLNNREVDISHGYCYLERQELSL